MPDIVEAAPAGGQMSVVLVHGAWADGSSWNAVASLLMDKGVRVVAVQNPLSSLADDVAATQRAIELQPGPVLLVGHAWGGVVITDAASNPKVKGLVYVAAFAPDEGESVHALLDDKHLPAPPGLAGIEADSGGYLWHSPENVAAHFAQDLPSKMTRLIAANQKPINSKAFSDTMRGAPAWKALPTWFVLAEQDHMIPPATQQRMATRMGSALTPLDSGHVVPMSRPKEVAAVILKAVEQVGQWPRDKEWHNRE